jgi:NAD-dependent DNA ligase
MSLAQFLGSFGVVGLGVRKAYLMMKAEPQLRDIENWFGQALLDKDIAASAGVPQVGEKIHKELQTMANLILATLPHVEILPYEDKPEDTVNQGGFKVCITGTLPSGKKKKDYAPLLAAAGHVLVDDFTKDVHILVDNSPAGKPSSKAKKAEKLGIKTIDEEGLVALCNTPAAPANTRPDTTLSDENSDPQPKLQTEESPLPKNTAETDKPATSTTLIAEAFQTPPSNLTQGNLF